MFKNNTKKLSVSSRRTLIIAGPCAAETEARLIRIAKKCKKGNQKSVLKLVPEPKNDEVHGSTIVRNAYHTKAARKYLIAWLDKTIKRKKD